MSDIENPILMENVKRPFNMFRSLLHHAKRDNMTKQSIFKVKESPRQFKLITDDEMSVILGALDKQRDRLLYKLLYLTGARIQEALDLEIESIPVPDMTQPIAVFQGIKSKGKYRDLYVPMSLVKELDDFVKPSMRLLSLSTALRTHSLKRIRRTLLRSLLKPKNFVRKLSVCESVLYRLIRCDIVQF